MAISPDQMLKWGTPFAFVGDLSGTYSSATAVVTPAASKIVTYNIGGQRSALPYGLVLTGIHLFSPADANARTLTISEYDGSTDYPIMVVGAMNTYATLASYDIWHPLKPGIQSGSSVTNGSTIRIVYSGAFPANSRIRLEGFHTSDPTLWSTYVSGRAKDAAITF